MFSRFLIKVVFILLVAPAMAQPKSEGPIAEEGLSKALNTRSISKPAPGTFSAGLSYSSGRLNLAFQDAFSMDNSNVRLGFNWEINPTLGMETGFSQFNREFDCAIFSHIVGKQGIGLDDETRFHLILQGGAIANLQKSPYGRIDKVAVADRLAFTGQVVAGWRFNHILDLQLMPSVIRQNYVDQPIVPRTYWILGVGATLYLTERWALLFERYHAFNRHPENNYSNPLTFGLLFDRAKNTLQLSLSNAPGANLFRTILESQNGNWKGFQIHLGLKYSRKFGF